MNKTTLENWEAEFDENFESLNDFIGYGNKMTLGQSLKNFIKDLLASSQKDKEKAVRRTLETVGAILNGDDNQVEIAKTYCFNKLQVLNLKSKKE